MVLVMLAPDDDYSDQQDETVADHDDREASALPNIARKESENMRLTPTTTKSDNENDVPTTTTTPKKRKKRYENHAKRV